MKIQFLGTGAADFDWSEIGKPGVRGSTSTLLNDRILVDAGVTGWENLHRFGVSPDALDALLITHSHQDHFSETVIARILEARHPASPKLKVFASPQAVSRLSRICGSRFEGVPLSTGTEFDLPGFHVVTLPANHRVEDFREECFHFLFLSPVENLLYALDGAWMMCKARALIGKTPIHTVVWEATMESPANFRIFEHSDLSMLDQMKTVLRTDGIFSGRTEFYVTHIAKTLWNGSFEDQSASAARHGYRMAFDGMTVQTHSDGIR